MEIKEFTEEVAVGSIETVVAGREHHGGMIGSGDAVSFKREPDNAHDGNAIGVFSERDTQAGYLPRRVAVWLAPLLDSDKVRIEGAVPHTQMGRQGICPLDLRVFVTKRGGDILARNPDPKDLRESLHQLVLSAYDGIGRLSEPGVAAQLGELLHDRLRHDASPETRMLLALIPDRVREVRAGQIEAILSEARATFRKAPIATPIRFGGLTVFPLLTNNGQDRGYVMLQEALHSGTAVVEEISAGGSVPELMLTNKGDLPILVPEGEILTGAKQNRVVNLTVIVAARSAFTIPVSCVERGRWASVSAGMKASHYAPPRMRANTNASVRESRTRSGAAQSDQGQVWDNVGSYLRSAKVESRTESLVDAYETSNDSIQAYRDNVRVPEGTSGVIVALGEAILGMEQFDSSRSFDTAWPKLSDSLFLEAVVSESAQATATVRDAEVFRDALTDDLTPVDTSFGLGARFDIGSNGFIGSAVYFQKHFCHVSAFAAAL